LLYIISNCTIPFSFDYYDYSSIRVLFYSRLILKLFVCHMCYHNYYQLIYSVCLDVRFLYTCRCSLVLLICYHSYRYFVYIICIVSTFNKTSKMKSVFLFTALALSHTNSILSRGTWNMLHHALNVQTMHLVSRSRNGFLNIAMGLKCSEIFIS